MFCKTICTEVPEKHKLNCWVKVLQYWVMNHFLRMKLLDFAQMTTADATNHSPLLTLRAAPMSRLMLRPADSTNMRPMKQRKIGHPCMGRNETRTFCWCLRAATLMLSCWLILSGPQTFSHEAGLQPAPPTHVNKETSLEGRIDKQQDILLRHAMHFA